MAMVELDEAQVAELNKVKTVMARMLTNPESRKKVLEAQKIINPQATIPELDAVKPINDAISAVATQVKDLAKKFDDEKAEREEKRARSELETKWLSGRNKAKDVGYTAEGLEALEKYMIDNGVADHEIGMAAFERTNPPAKPIMNSNPGPSVLDSINSTSDEMKRLMETRGEDRHALNSLVQKTLTDIRSGGR